MIVAHAHPGSEWNPMVLLSVIYFTWLGILYVIVGISKLLKRVLSR